MDYDSNDNGRHYIPRGKLNSNNSFSSSNFSPIRFNFKILYSLSTKRTKINGGLRLSFICNFIDYRKLAFLIVPRRKLFGKLFESFTAEYHIFGKNMVRVGS